MHRNLGTCSNGLTRPRLWKSTEHPNQPEIAAAEWRIASHWHPVATALNSGTAALVYVLR